jgi:hypothetical protein
VVGFDHILSDHLRPHLEPDTHALPVVYQLCAKLEFTHDTPQSRQGLISASSLAR